VTSLRFLLDDATPCKTQQAVLSVFAADLEKRARGTVIRASQLTGMRQWADVPAESSRRLGLRLLALQPAADQLTVFLPGHIVPGTIDTGSRWGSALAAREFSTVADLDLFALDSTGSEVRQFHEFVAAHPDYESVSRYAGFTSAALPGWLVSGGLTSALQLTQRPWYCAHAPTRLQWLGWVKRAVERGLLDLSMVEEDVRTGMARPSLVAEVKAVMQGTDAPALPDLTLDTLFMAPERRLTDIQHRLLHSVELQKRTIQFARRNATQKLAKQGLLKYLQRSLRRLPRLGFHAAYLLYSMTLRPAVKRIRQQLNTRP
jgi:hypothetical protein